MSRRSGKIAVMVCPEPRVAPGERLTRRAAKEEVRKKWDFDDLPGGSTSHGYPGGSGYGWSMLGEGEGCIYPQELGGEG